MSTEQEQPTVNIGDNNSHNSISIFGTDIRQAISTGIIISCLLLSIANMNMKYGRAMDEIHAIKLEQVEMKVQIERMTQHIDKSQK